MLFSREDAHTCFIWTNVFQTTKSKNLRRTLYSLGAAEVKGGCDMWESPVVRGAYQKECNIMRAAQENTREGVDETYVDRSVRRYDTAMRENPASH